MVIILSSFSLNILSFGSYFISFLRVGARLSEAAEVAWGRKATQLGTPGSVPPGK